jgi:hypothetical protein
MNAEPQLAFSVIRPAPLSASRCPQGLRPEIARIIEELARAAVRRENRHAQEYRAIRQAMHVGAEQR